VTQLTYAACNSRSKLNLKNREGKGVEIVGEARPARAIFIPKFASANSP
jgi:hypothetical protein